MPAEAKKFPPQRPRHRKDVAKALASTRVSLRDKLILAELESARRFVFKLLSTRGQAQRHEDDLVAVAMEALIESADRYRPQRGPFSLFARYRVRGAVMDYLRKLDPVTRHYRSKIRRGESVPDVVAARQVITGPSAEIAISQVVGDDMTPEAATAFGEMRAALEEAIKDALTEREKGVLSLIYMEGLTLAEVGYIIGVSESRVCQIVKGAQKKLAVALAAEKEGHLDVD